jgi:hypothetical protein
MGIAMASGSAGNGAPPQPTYAQVVRNLQDAGVPLGVLGGQGCAAVTPAAGRIVALSFGPDGENLFWSNPQLGDSALVRNTPEKLVGGMGGDRLWFSPELDFHWTDKPDWATFANYHIPAASDPGAYVFVDGPKDAVTLRGRGELKATGAERRVAFEVERSVRFASPPLPADSPLLKRVRYVGLETRHHVRLGGATREGRLGLWHLLQLPVDSVLVVPRRSTQPAEQGRPLCYGLPGAWEEKADHVRWRYGGLANAKFGLSAAALTGRTAALRLLGDGQWLLIVRDFEVDPRAMYCDHPFGVPRDDQAFQAWDGYGFGEMEFHSPALDGARGPRERRETDRLWAFGGAAPAIEALAKKLLGVDVGDILGP